MKNEKRPASSCETKYMVQWDIEVQDLEPLTCPFCGHEVEEVEEDEGEDTIWTNESEDDSWN